MEKQTSSLLKFYSCFFLVIVLLSTSTHRLIGKEQKEGKGYVQNRSFFFLFLLSGSLVCTYTRCFQGFCLLFLSCLLVRHTILKSSLKVALSLQPPPNKLTFSGLLGPGHTVSKSYDSASKDFVASFASRSHGCFGSVSWWFCIERGGERNHVHWFFSRALASMLSCVSLTACQFVFWTHWGNDCMPKHSWRKTILLLSKLRLGLYGILELAWSRLSLRKYPPRHFSWFCCLGFSKRVNVIDAKKKKSGVQPVGFVETTQQWALESSKQGTLLWSTNLALSCVASTHSFEKQYKNRLMQNHAMEITAGRAMRHRAILGDFASPDSQIAMETSIIGCRIARFCFSVTGL